MIANGVEADATDEYVRVGESTSLECLRKFVVTVVEVFGPKYLRLANGHDTARLLAIGESRGFPSMLDSINCMHWDENIVLLYGIVCTGAIKRAYNYIRSSCFKRPIYLACILQDARLPQ
jgi:hypothetical protein